MPDTCSYWEGCNAPATHVYGGSPYCREHDVRTPEEATIDSLRSQLAVAEKALEPYGELFDYYGGEETWGGPDSSFAMRVIVRARDLHAAREALARIEGRDA